MLSLLYKLEVKDIMDKDILTIEHPTNINRLIELLLKNNKEEILVVDKEGEIIDIVTFENISSYLNVKKLNLNKNILSVSPDTKVTRARQYMIRNKIGRLPVIYEGELVGIIRKETLLTNLYSASKQLNSNLYKVLNNIQEGVCIIDDQGVVLFWNQNAEKIYDIKKEDILNKKLKEHFNNPILHEVLNKKRSFNNVKHSPRDGSQVAISARPIYIEGELAGAVSTERDITEISKLAWKLEKTQKRLNDCMGSDETDNNLEDKPKRFSEIIGESEIIRNVITKSKKVAKTELGVLILGESGTGKELFARAIHEESEREGDFIPVNCSAINENLFESEMFGYVEGAFTGASKKGKKGFFELANNGTLFLDEIGEMPISMQPKLLRALQEKQIKRVGGEEYIDINVRIISATNKNLKDLVEKGEFREDLYYRINVIELNLPPLRKRKKDIPLLLEHFLQEYCNRNNIKNLELKPEVLGALMKYDWEGNIRELKNIISHLIAFSNDGIIDINSLPKKIIDKIDQQDLKADKDYGLEDKVADLERQEIKKALKNTKGNKKKASDLLKIPRSTLYYKMKLYNIRGVN